MRARNFAAICTSILAVSWCCSNIWAADVMPFGYVDTFEDGTVMGYSGGAQVENVPTGGPQGSGDGYLKVSVENGHLGTKNDKQWGGAYWNGEPRVDLLTNNITLISADVKNLGDIDIDLRLVLTGGNQGGGRWVSTDAYTLAVGCDWTHVEWTLDGQYWTRTTSNGVFNKLLDDLGRITFHHDPGDPDAHGGIPDVTGAMGIDNVAAVPEPATMALLAIAGVSAIRRRR